MCRALSRRDCDQGALNAAGRRPIVLSVSWLATVTPHADSLNMAAFAEPLRCGLQNQWFPDTEFRAT